MIRAVRDWQRQADFVLAAEDAGPLVKQLNHSYVIYGTLLLFPVSLLESQIWRAVNRQGDNAVQDLLMLVAKHLKVTRIAVTKPIPLQVDGDDSLENVVRSPSNFMPLYGDFGPETRETPPTQDDFDKAYWVTAKQNSISQTWAPRWTMFSRGNISEKARILELPTVASAVAEGVGDGRGCSAVDLYAGIGYFVFSYLKAGVSKVLCWDLNPWSIEGLRRGSTANKWKAVTHDGGSGVDHMATYDVRLLIFNESNEHATARLKTLRKLLPPVRHVNCGLLPTSRGTWTAAFAVLDSTAGGWVHVHENFELSEIADRAEEVRMEFQKMYDMAYRTGRSGVVLEHITRVKTYAPGVFHVVLDIYIPPHADAT
ncbi:S-adenosylmethionine-dependent methyltransferase, partial [Oleoguttula sp. CCFEE 5521]